MWVGGPGCVLPSYFFSPLCASLAVYVRCVSVSECLSAFLFVCTYGLCVGLCSFICFVCVFVVCVRESACTWRRYSAHTDDGDH